MNGLHDLLFERAEEVIHSRADGSPGCMRRETGRLPPDLMAAYLLGTLNYQVENGGFRQWVTNGYCLDIYTIIRLLENKVRRPASMQLAITLRRVASYVDLYAMPRGAFGSYLKNCGDEKDLDVFDTPYYRLRDELRDEWENFFHRMLYGIKTDWDPVPRLVSGNLFQFREISDWGETSHLEISDVIDTDSIGTIEENNGLLSGTVYVGY